MIWHHDVPRFQCLELFGVFLNVELLVGERAASVLPRKLLMDAARCVVQAPQLINSNDCTRDDMASGVPRFQR